MRKRKTPNSPSQREEFKRQMEEKKLSFPIEVEAYYVERIESDKHGDTVRPYSHLPFQSNVAHTPEELRKYGNMAKEEAANCNYFNVMVVCTQANGETKSLVYPRKVPKGIEDVTKTTDERMVEKVTRQLKAEQDATRGVNDFTPDKTEFEDFIDDQGEPELSDE